MVDLGRMSYGKAYDLQRKLVEARIADSIPDVLLFVEHPHVITAGRNSENQNLLISKEGLADRGYEFFETDRGGDFTYHGPGQIVGYPIFQLKEWKQDVAAFLRTLEEVLIQSLSDFDIQAGRREDWTGVWVGDTEPNRRKIVSIGIHLKRWVTSHGFALNWKTDMEGFQLINPCGLMDRLMTSIESEVENCPDSNIVKSAIALHAASQFQKSLKWVDLEQAEVLTQL